MEFSNSNFSADDYNFKAEECLEKREFELALKFCERALCLNPCSVKALQTRGLLFLEADDAENALKCFLKATESPDVLPSTYMYLGQISDGVQAVSFIQKGIEKLISLAERVGSNQQTGDLNQINKKISIGYVAICDVYLTDLCYEEDAEKICVDFINKAIKHDPQNAQAWQTLASIQLSCSDPENALKSINKSVALWYAPLKDGIVGKTTMDTSEIEDTVLISDLPFEFRLSAAKILIELQQYDIAEDILQALLEEDDEAIQAWYVLGWLHHLQNEYTLAKEEFLKTLELSSKNEIMTSDMIDHTKELLNLGCYVTL